MELIVVRHGRPERVEGASGGADPALTDIGHRQAQAMADWLSGESIDALYVSPMVRARQTSEPLEKALSKEATIVADVREFDATESSYIPMDEIKKDKALWKEWLQAERGVDRSDFHKATRAAVKGIVADHPRQRVVIVCHGGVINSIGSEILGLDDAMFFSPDYSSINRFLIASNGTRSVLSLNDIGHLRPFPELQLL